ncbi:MAG: nucleotidyltransferase family protein [Elusimicrobia bacterium]|nr:nucleotidyltransferase family protein [Elusimicrobiota bacterium]
MNFPAEAVLLVGGLGTRLKTLTQNIPKPMLSVGDRPFLEHLILRLKKEGIARFILATAYLSDKMRDYFGDGRKWGITIVYSDPQGRQLGTAGSIKEAEEEIEGKQFFAFNGDVYFDVSLRELWEFHQRKKARATLALARLADTGRYGTVSIDGAGAIAGFLEKNKNPTGADALINGGAYVFDKSILGLVPAGKDFSLEYHVFPKLAGKSLYGLLFPRAFFIDIGTPEDYQRAQELLPPLLPR